MNPSTVPHDAKEPFRHSAPAKDCHHDRDCLPPRNYYPVGAFIVQGKENINNVVVRLREMKRLKKGKNVTVFDPSFCRVLPLLKKTDTTTIPREESGGLTTVSLYVEEEEDHLQNFDESVVRSVGKGEKNKRRVALDAYVLNEKRQREWREKEKILPFYTLSSSVVSTSYDNDNSFLFSSLTTPQGESLPYVENPPYYAIHVLDYWNTEELISFLSIEAPFTGRPRSHHSGEEGKKSLYAPPMLGFILGLRLYSRCCTPVLADLPPTVLEMRHKALHTKSVSEVPRVTSSPLPPKSSSSIKDKEDGRESVSFTYSELFSGIGMFRLGVEVALRTRRRDSEFDLHHFLKNGDYDHTSGGTSASFGECAFSVECAAPAVTVYEKNFCLSGAKPLLQDPARPQSPSCHPHHAGGRVVAVDVSSIPSSFFPHHTLLTAGFPCQSFSKSNYLHQPRTGGGEKEGCGTPSYPTPSPHELGLLNPKGQLFFEVVRVLRSTRPTFFLLENVSFLTEINDGRDLTEVILPMLRQPFQNPYALFHHNSDDGEAAPSFSYRVIYRVLNNHLVTPQERKRIYFIGTLQGTHDGACPPSSSSSTTTTTNISLDEEEYFNRVTHTLTEWRGRLEWHTVGDVLLDTTPPPQFPPDTTTTTPTLSNTTQGSGPRGLKRPRPLPEESITPWLQEYLASFQLTTSQWNHLLQMPKNKSFLYSPHYRVADLNGTARTLLSSYKMSYQLYSEFVPFFFPPPKEENKERNARSHCESIGTETTRRRAQLMQQTLEELTRRIRWFREQTGEGEEEEVSRETPSATAVPTQSALHGPPPLRFYTPRECARLQGIPDWFDFLLSEEREPSVSSSCLLSSGSPPDTTTTTRTCLSTNSVYRLVNNAVNPLVIACLIRELLP